MMSELVYHSLENERMKACFQAAGAKNFGLRRSGDFDFGGNVLLETPSNFFLGNSGQQTGGPMVSRGYNKHSRAAPDIEKNGGQNLKKPRLKRGTRR